MDATVENIAQLRLLIGDTAPEGDSRRLLTDEELSPVLGRALTMFGAAAEGWAIKAALYAEYIDMDESGSSRKLNQLFKNAAHMMKHYASAAGEELEKIQSTGARYAGAISAKWGEHAGKRALHPLGSVPETTSTLQHLTHRSPSILQ